MLGRHETKTSYRLVPHLCASCAIALLLSASLCYPQQSELKPRDTIGPNNWQLVKGMVGENFLDRIRRGYSLRIKEPKLARPPKKYLEATDKYSSQVGLRRNGELRNYVAGIPFPKVDFADPDVGLKLAWNFYWRWLGDDSKTGGGMKGGKEIVINIEQNGSERLSHKVIHFIRTRSRISIDPKPYIPGYSHIDWMQMIAHDYPREVSGITTLEIRYTEPSVTDDLFVYVPAIRRVRRANSNPRCSTLAPTEFNSDDINTFNGKILDFNYRFFGEKRVLGNFSQSELPFQRKNCDYMPLQEGWEIHDTYGLEITPKQLDYCYSKKILFVEKRTFEPLWAMMWDKNGSYWKEQFALRTATRLQNDEEIISPGTVVIVNVQSGRASLVTAVRSYDQGYSPNFFTLATLQQVLRGGSIR